MNNLVRRDAGSSVTGQVRHDLVTAGITVATVVAVMAIPVFGWVAGIVGGGYVVYRGAKKGLKNR